MKKTYLILLILLSALTYGQETIKKTKIYTNPNFKEIYYVLKSDKEILEGSYKKLNSSDKVLVEGFYKNGAKDSLWKEYSWWGKLSKKGKYQDNIRVGVWECYDYKGKLEISYDYSTSKLIFYEINEKDKNKEYKVIIDGGTEKIKLDRPPLYIDGSSSIFDIINSNLKYPVKAQEYGVSGKVEITFTIDSDGKTSNYRITRRIGSGCDEEALRVVKMIPDNWLPGILVGKPVNVEYVLPINFKLE
jgi:periplasmic protein TonB